MKKILPLLLLNFTIWSCTWHKSTANHIHDIPAEINKGGIETKEEKLVLNNGVKWKVDTVTNHNVHRIMGLLNKFDKIGDKSLPAYRAMHGELQERIDTLIAECKMRGQDYIALHKWLEPLITEVAKLKEAPTAAGAANVVNAINQQAGLYVQYFQCSANNVLIEKRF